jgi:hypothetical protein
MGHKRRILSHVNQDINISKFAVNNRLLPDPKRGVSSIELQSNDHALPCDLNQNFSDSTLSSHIHTFKTKT